MTMQHSDVYEIRLKLDTTNSWIEAVEIAARLQMQIKKYADHTNTPIGWREREVEVLGAPTLILQAPADFVKKIENFPEVVSVEPAQYPTKPQSTGGGPENAMPENAMPENAMNDNKQQITVRKAAPKPPRM